MLYLPLAVTLFSWYGICVTAAAAVRHTDHKYSHTDTPHIMTERFLCICCFFSWEVVISMLYLPLAVFYAHDVQLSATFSRGMASVGVYRKACNMSVYVCVIRVIHIISVLLCFISLVTDMYLRLMYRFLSSDCRALCSLCIVDRRS